MVKVESMLKFLVAAIVVLGFFAGALSARACTMGGCGGWGGGYYNQPVQWGWQYPMYYYPTYSYYPSYPTYYPQVNYQYQFSGAYAYSGGWNQPYLGSYYPYWGW
jgi:hypothetical protein